MRDTFGIELPLRTVFDSHTIAGMIGALERLEPAPAHLARIAELRRRIESASPDEIPATVRPEANGDG